VVVVALGIGLGVGLTSGSSGNSSGLAGLPLAPISSLGPVKPAPPSGPLGPEGVPIPPGPTIAPAGSPAPGSVVDGIKCEPGEQVLFHIHAHLTVIDGGATRRVPYGIGIAPPRGVTAAPGGPFVVRGSCFFWLHTHAADGIIHVESPVQRTYTLGNFFDIWHQPLGRNQVGPLHGHVTALLDGQAYTGDPRSIPLLSHGQIQLEVGKPLVQQQTISSWDGL
jgi:hypothetical protein